MEHQFSVIEPKWQKKWEEQHAFEAKNDYTLPKYYALVEFPYPSGQGLHIGHPRPYTALDVVSRHKRMQGRLTKPTPTRTLPKPRPKSAAPWL